MEVKMVQLLCLFLHYNKVQTQLWPFVSFEIQGLLLTLKAMYVHKWHLLGLNLLYFHRFIKRDLRAWNSRKMVIQNQCSHLAMILSRAALHLEWYKKWTLIIFIVVELEQWPTISSSSIKYKREGIHPWMAVSIFVDHHDAGRKAGL